MKFCVIGLGRFGYQVAVVLAENGMEVMAIDSSETLVASIRDRVTQAICMRVTDEESLKTIGIEEIDTAIVGVGEAFDQSVLITALLKKIGIAKVISRGTSDIHKDILKLVGADRVILPEKEIGIRLADTLSSPFTDLNRLSKHFSVSQIITPHSFVGKQIDELDLYNRFRVRCIGLRENDERVVPIDPDHVVQAGDRLIFAGENSDLERIK